MIITDAEQLAEQIDRIRGTTFLTLWARTEPEMLARDSAGNANPFRGKIFHEWGRCVTFGADYERAVNRAWAKATNGQHGTIRGQRKPPPGELFDKHEDLRETFDAAGLWCGYGERLNRFLARHKETGQLYLVYMLQSFPPGHPRAGFVKGPLFNRFVWKSRNQPIVPGRLLPFLRVRQPSTKQQVRRFGAIEQRPRTVMLQNLLQLNMGGEVLEVQIPASWPRPTRKRQPKQTNGTKRQIATTSADRRPSAAKRTKTRQQTGSRKTAGSRTKSSRKKR